MTYTQRLIYTSLLYPRWKKGNIHIEKLIEIKNENQSWFENLVATRKISEQKEEKIYQENP